MERVLPTVTRKRNPLPPIDNMKAVGHQPGLEERTNVPLDQNNRRAFLTDTFPQVSYEVLVVA